MAYQLPAREMLEPRIHDILTYMKEHSSLDRSLDPVLYSYDYENRSITFRYTAPESMANVFGNLQGGFYAVLFDEALGLCASFWSRVDRTPTVSLNVNYIHEAHPGDTLLVTARLEHVGRTVIHLSGSCCLEAAPEKPVMTATGVFFNSSSEAKS